MKATIQMQLTEKLDLRGGRPCWQDADPSPIPSDPLPHSTEIAIVGAGIMGAMLAYRLSREGHRVALIDRRPPACGSTAASTALILWAADVPLLHLSGQIGAEKAATAWRRVYRAVRNLDDAITARKGDCQWRSRPELYLAGTLLDEAGLRAEGAIRRAAELPTRYLEPGVVADRFGLPPRAALLSDDTFGVDPVALTLDLLTSARSAGATITFPVSVIGLDETGCGITLDCHDGSQIAADRVILATGYEAARWYLPSVFSLGSSFAIATGPGEVPAWREKALIWEAADPYLYARATTDGRLIVGGEDEGVSDPHARDRLLGAKRGTLEAKGAALLGRDALTADCAWSATFGRSPDGLPAIGRARNSERVWLAAGFGGNGISFAALAADLLASGFAGSPDADACLFDPYRFD